MDFTASNLNKFLLLKLPSAFICGVRAKEINEKNCIATVKHRWINQNPFQSMYFAVQAMAAELTTGALVMLYIRKSGRNISMLVANNKSTFHKKATGRITFTCNEGESVQQAVKTAVETGEGQTLWLKSTGKNEDGIVVSEMHFEWTLKLKA